MQPTNSDVHVDAALTNISIAYLQDESTFIADKVFPIVPVSKQSDKYFIYDRNDFFRDEAKKRAPNTESAGGGYNLGTDSYFADVWAFHKDVADQTTSNEDEVIDGESDAAEFTMQKLLIRRERQFVTKYMATGIWTTDKTGGTDFVKWDDEAASDPIVNPAGAEAAEADEEGAEALAALALREEEEGEPELPDDIAEKIPGVAGHKIKYSWKTKKEKE